MKKLYNILRIEKMKVLALGAHPDDIEIFMYGLINAFKIRGDEVHLAVATDGAAGNICKSKNLIEIRKKETIRGLYKLGTPDLMGLSDGNISNNQNAFIVINNYIKSIKPDLIITHDPMDYHPDHRSLSQFVTDSAGFICPVLFVDTLMGVNFLPDFYIDITSSYEEKKYSILCHKSQSPEKFVSAVSLQNSFRAAQCNLSIGNFAECYRYERRFPFSDLNNLLPNLISCIPYYKNEKNALI